MEVLTLRKIVLPLLQIGGVFYLFKELLKPRKGRRNWWKGASAWIAQCLLQPALNARQSKILSNQSTFFFSPFVYSSWWQIRMSSLSTLLSLDKWGVISACRYCSGLPSKEHSRRLLDKAGMPQPAQTKHSLHELGEGRQLGTRSKNVNTQNSRSGHFPLPFHRRDLWNTQAQMWQTWNH